MADLGLDLVLTKGKVAPQFLDEKAGVFVVAKGEDGTPFYRALGTVAMEAWTDQNPIATFPDNRYGFSIVNDGTADLTFTINTFTRTVKVGEAYSSLFDAFTSVTINATGAYRAEVMR